MEEWLYSAGDEVMLVGNTNDDDNDVGWCPEMNNMIGDVFTIKRVDSKDGVFMYTLEGDPYDYWYDEAWLSPALRTPLPADEKELDSFFAEM